MQCTATLRDSTPRSFDDATIGRWDGVNAIRW